MKNPADLIMNLGEAVKWRQQLTEKGKSLVVTNGCFDIMHRGHLEYLFETRSFGNALLILMNSDSSVRQLKGKSRPIIDEYSRAYMLAAFDCVDAVVFFNGERCTAEFRAIKPDIYVKGGDYNIDTINREEKKALLNAGTEIRFIPFIEGFSSSGIIKKIKSIE